MTIIQKGEPMSDLISRQAAIDALKGLPTWWADEGGYYGGARPPMVALLDPEDSVSAIENLPSAEPRKKGKWLRSGSAIFPCECDQCGDTTERNTPFCPHCGADMTGGEEE